MTDLIKHHLPHLPARPPGGGVPARRDQEYIYFEEEDAFDFRRYLQILLKHKWLILAFLVTGAYGKPVLKQNGAPLRLAVPWKYGFKSTKGIVRFSFTDKRPVSFWEEIQSREYGFWANVNPKVPHPRWSQATERVLGTPGRVPTQLYNGYGEFVADLYKDMTGERLFT